SRRRWQVPSAAGSTATTRACPVAEGSGRQLVMAGASRPTKPRSPRLLRVTGGQPLSRVGVIAVVGFFVGVAWPRLAGVSLVPEAPLEDTSKPAPAEDGVEPTPVEAETKEIKPVDQLEIGKAQITSCRDQEGKAQSSC